MEVKKIRPLKELIPFEKRKKPSFTLPDETEVFGELLDEVEIEDKLEEQNKVYKRLVQKIRWDDGREEFRFCYYYMDLNEEKPKWVFGQYALMFTAEQFKDIIEKMKEKGWI